MYGLITYLCPAQPAGDEAVYISELMKQRNLLDLDWALANQNMAAEPNRYGSGSGAISKVRCPVALTTAPFDPIVPRSMVEENLKALPQARLIEYPGCAHAPIFFCPDKLAKDIDGFIADKSV